VRTYGKEKQKQKNAELLLVQVQEKKSYDFFAALAKALLLFLLVYGALGGFLSAFEIEYNKGLCMLVLFAFALALSAAYETRKRWFTNLVCLVVFGIYLVMGLSNYWIINSGYYALMNEVFSKAREYLDISSGVEYSMVVQDDYSTVTLLVLFVGMVGIILLNIQIQDKCSLLKLVLITFSPYVVPFYLECSPAGIYIILLFTGYIVALILQSGNVRMYLTGQMRYILPVVAVVVVLFVQLFAIVMPEAQYNRMVKDSAWKESTKDEVSKLAQFGMSALFKKRDGGSGMNGGMLSKSSGPVHTYETDLLVRYTPYSYDAVYLKAFTGKDYDGDRWTQAEETGIDDGRMEAGLQSRKEAYESNSEKQGKGVFEVVNVGADIRYEYRPYYTDYDNIESKGNVSTYIYYPAGGKFELDGEVNSDYLYVPANCSEAVEEICSEAGFAGTPEEIVPQIIKFFQDNYSYTLRPGFYYGNPDYISHFLLESKKGYCAHFASAGTMLFRQMGIPARYVEGYAFSYFNVIEDAVLLEDVAYSDYYDGYAPMGETAVIELEVPDACAHAWVEIYIDEVGWVVVDPTPASEEQENRSFWDAFMSMGEGAEAPDLTDGDFGAYLESALSGAGYLLILITVITGGIFVVKHVVRMKRERAMGARERVQLEYSRLQQCLVRKNRANQSLRTIAQQINCMRMRYGMDITKEQEEALYQVYFAPEVFCDCVLLRKELVALRKKLRTQKESKDY